MTNIQKYLGATNTKQIGFFTPPFNQLVLGYWTNQNQNATKKVLRWLYCLLPKRDAI